jgi:oxepin-CoA hydrolase/3-oxo-5,6-dehydrosuberyl-CoA semialdehyde dehydrogenase
MLEKLGPTLLAGVPIVAGVIDRYLTELAMRIMIEADVLPAGAHN